VKRNRSRGCSRGKLERLWLTQLIMERWTIPHVRHQPTRNWPKSTILTIVQIDELLYLLEINNSTIVPGRLSRLSQFSCCSVLFCDRTSVLLAAPEFGTTSLWHFCSENFRMTCALKSPRPPPEPEASRRGCPARDQA
jgi:hypothetical protein